MSTDWPAGRKSKWLQAGAKDSCKPSLIMQTSGSPTVATLCNQAHKSLLLILQVASVASANATTIIRQNATLPE
jgi:hypothetical protein